MMSKESTILREEMKDDLMRVYREVVMQHGCRNQKEAYELTVTHPAPRFYVDARRAHQRISPMMKGDRSQLQHMCPLRREMYETIFEKVLELMQKEKFWTKSLYCVIRHALQEPAPRFYINPIRMGQIWRERASRRVKAETVRKIAERRIRNHRVNVGSDDYAMAQADC